MKFFITGANGFVGKHLCSELKAQGCEIYPVSRAQQEINGYTDWGNSLAGISVVIHLAARAHILNENSVDPLSEFRKVNVEGTEHLARCAAIAGVKRFVFISSIGVHGLFSTSKPFEESSRVAPHNAYTLSKWEAEMSLARVAEETGMEVVIIRPPLVYGVGVPGNFAQMMKVLASGFPLPLASICNRRSLVYVGNLVDAIIVCATHPRARGQTYLVNDGEDVSTPELLRRLGVCMESSARLFKCPPAFLEWAGRVFGKSDQVTRLLGSLQVDSGKIRRELNWKPPYTLQQGLQETAAWYRDTHL